jgi:hypothetical protein
MLCSQTFVIISLRAAKLATHLTEATMATKKKRRAWTKQDERELRSHSKNKSPIKTVVRATKRTAGALRQKAFSMGLSLGHRRSSKRKKTR